MFKVSEPRGPRQLAGARLNDYRTGGSMTSANNTNISHSIYVLGDLDTSQRMDLLEAKAAEHGAVIGQTFAFGPGEASGADDLSTVEAVVEALGRAIATRTDVWLPFWLQDVCREQHLRTLSVTLQRHGLNLLLGPQLMPVPAEGGINDMDAAMRNEIRGVWRLDDAAMAAAGMKSLGTEIEEFLAQPGVERAVAEEPPVEEELRERHFTTAEAANLLGKSQNWVSRGLRQQAFAYADGSPIEPLREPNSNRHALTVPMVRAIAWSAYRRGTLSPQRLQEVLAAVRNER